MRAAQDISRRKVMGVYYTPVRLAEFLASHLVRQVSSDARLRILDPACGDGVLLEALLVALRQRGINECEACGVEVEEEALLAAGARLSRFENINLHLIHGDFLDLVAGGNGQRELWEASHRSLEVDQAFDLVIANPPYVRTQALGAERARQLAQRFGLTGRVDLYHAFIVGMTEALRGGGAMGIITSNRFLSTLGGASIRRYLAREFDIDEVIDLGDTKIFSAAVLPAIFVGRRRRDSQSGRTSPHARFIKVYSRRDVSDEEAAVLRSGGDLFDILNCGRSGCYRVSEGVFEVTCGDLELDRDSGRMWCLTTRGEAEWVARVRGASAGVLGDVAVVRVGIKTTADEVFIRSDWDSLPPPMRPEPELLRPLISHEHTRRWVPSTEDVPPLRVLYPHEVSGGVRKVVDLGRYPRAKAYLESHRDRLEKRRYVKEAGRQWYEIWVPQDPQGWSAPKIVFPDISPDPRFGLDLQGRLVDGNCYWITLRPGPDPDTIYLLLGVANSRLMSRFHDLAFNNKLYASRRRYMTQYVSQYPYPDIASPASRKLIALVKEAVQTRASAEDEWLDAQVDGLVEEAFGLLSCEAAP